MSKRFFACIGNPPYQDDNDNNNRKRPMYDSMMDACFGIAHKVEFITPARFLFDAGQTPKDWNRKMLDDPHFKVLEYDANSADVFRGVDIKGGVAVSYRDDTRTYVPINVFIPFDELRSAYEKVSDIADEWIPSVITSGVPYRFSDELRVEHQEAVELVGKSFDVRSNAFDKLHDIVFFDEKPEDGEEYVAFIGRLNNRRMTQWIKRKYVIVPENFEKYKVIVPKANGSGAIGEVLSTPMIGTPMIGTPMIGYTQTFIGIGAFDTETEAQACMKYIKTKFARAMLGILKITQDNSSSMWRCVPLQDFTSNSDIDWLQPIPDIDRELYTKYGLSDEEIAFIEERVKAMD